MIDLRSDTVTKPSPAMREAMATAEVGDDVFGEDPTVNRLQETAARLLGKDYWIKDNILPNAVEIAERCFNKSAWVMGWPWRAEAWPGMRAPDALLPNELTVVEEWVKSQIGVKALHQQGEPPAGVSGHNHAQIVGGGNAVARPHVDSSKLCNYAGVLFLHPYPPTKHSGTSFYRLRLPDGTLGGNICPPPYESLAQIPGFEKGSDLTMWEEDVEVRSEERRVGKECRL